MVVLILVVGNGSVRAQGTPRVIAHQGRLLNSQSIPITTPVSVKFAIYDGSNNQVWNETKTITPDALGFYETLLGDSQPFPRAPFPDPAYLEITVANEVLSPRLRLGTEPFAQSAGAVADRVDVKTFGARGDGACAPTDDSAINSAIDALPAAGGVVFFPPGVYCTSGIVIATKPVQLLGSGGGCDLPVPDMRHIPLDCPTVIKSITNAPIVKFSMPDRLANDFPTRFQVGIRDIAVEGNGCGNPALIQTCANGFAALNDQHCLQIDNRGFEAYDATLADCGGHGLYLTDSVASNFYNLRVGNANGDGINIDDSSTAAQHGSNNASNFFGGVSSFNGGAGLRVVRNGWGTSAFGFAFEKNHGYGIDLEGTDASQARFSRFQSIWDENNDGGSVYFGTNALDNMVDYVRYSSGDPRYQRHDGRNLVSGSNVGSGPTGTSTDVTSTTLSDTSQTWQTDQFAGRDVYLGGSHGVVTSNTQTTLTLASGWSGGQPSNGAYEIEPDQGLRQQFQTIITSSGVTSSDVDALHIRTSDGAEDGNISVGSIIMRSPLGRCFRIKVQEDGTLSATKLESTTTLGSEVCVQ